MRGIRSVAEVAAGLLVAAAVVQVGPAAAQTPPPTVVVTPDAIVDGGQVEVDISGDFPVGYTALVVCESVAATTSGSERSQCGVLTLLAIPGLPPAHVSAAVPARSTSFDGTRTIDCDTTPGGCVVGVVTVQDTSATIVLAKAFEPITFLPSLTASPSRGLTDGATVTVEGTHAPAGEWTLAQCTAAYVDDPTPTQTAALCGPAMPVTSDTEATLTADVIVHDPVAPTGGASTPCGYTGCVVVLANPTTPLAAWLGISFGPAAVTVEPSTGLFDGTTVTVSVRGAPAPASFAFCALPLATSLVDSQCGGNTPLESDDWGSGSTTATVAASLAVVNGGTIDCRVAACAVGLFDADGNTVAASTPLTFAPPTTMTLEPTSGLLDGEAMTVTGRNLPTRTYVLRHCATGGCDEGQAVTVPPSGDLDATFPAVQRFTATTGARMYCRDHCTVALFTGSSDELVAVVGYAMAEGELTVTPDTSLGDGQTVQVTGSDLMPSYAGPTLLVFPTGGWALTQCDAAVLNDLHLLGFFTHCAVLPPTRAIDIAGSTLHTTFPAASTITKILGGTTDCTTSPDACVIGLMRLEQDASLSHHLVPVAFG
jgi:hypothetical protein